MITVIGKKGIGVLVRDTKDHKCWNCGYPISRGCLFFNILLRDSHKNNGHTRPLLPVHNTCSRNFLGGGKVTTLYKNNGSYKILGTSEVLNV